MMCTTSPTHRTTGLLRSLTALLCDDAANLIHLPAYMIEHRHTVHDAGTAEFYHPTRSEIVSAILDRLCTTLEGAPHARAPE